MSPPYPGAAPSAARVAVLERRGKFLVAEPFFTPGARLAVSRDARAGVGDLVVLRRLNGRARRGSRAAVARRIGRPEIARDVIEALMIDRGLRRSFDPTVEHDAREEAAVGAEHEVLRKDLRGLPTLTVDPPSARDFDDAISARRERDGSVRVWVHIADVAAFVPTRSLTDREAYRRATSVYVPGAVEPMLPEALSNHACSLVPGQDRLAVTVEMLLDGGRVTQSAFYRSVIRSDERLDYDRVDRIFAGRERALDPWAASLQASRMAAAVLAAGRSAHGALVLDSREPEFSFDRQGNVVSATAVAQTEAHRLIEHLMIAANEQVAARLEARSVPTLFRVHAPPDATAVERLFEQLASLEVPTPPMPSGHISARHTGELVGAASQLLERWVTRHGGGQALRSLVLRSLKQAYYDHGNIGHAGLSLTHYCHFTSPIRRYPDLVCHRALLSTLGGEPAPERPFVVSAGPWTSSREREAMTIERDADDIARCFLLERELRASGAGTAFEGEVVGLVGSGAFVAFGEDGIYEGMLPVRRMPGDWWELNEEATMLVAARSGKRIRLGDQLEIQVDGIDAARGRVDLVPASSAAEGSG